LLFSIFGFGHCFELRASSFDISAVITSARQLAELVEAIKPLGRVAVDTEADSLHAYREKLCLLQISISNGDFIVDPLAGLDLTALRDVLVKKEIVLHGADYDLRLLRRNLNLTPAKIFDTVIAARMIGIREFSYAALVKRYFDVELAKSSQKANWGERPLSKRMEEYAINDTRYLLPLVEQLETELARHQRLDWFRQSCQRALELAAIDRERVVDEAWRISGAGALRGRASAVLRELWNWRECEAEASDRPPFHILQNRELISSAEKFAAGESADYKHFSDRRRRTFREAAKRGLVLEEKDWPVRRRRAGTRPTAEVVRRTEKLRQNRDHAAKELHIEASFIAPRATLEAIAADQSRADALLVPWQRDLVKL
jgi:ribonuclease D